MRMILVSKRISIARIFEGISQRGDAKRQRGCRKRKVLAFSLVTSSEISDIRHRFLAFR